MKPATATATIQYLARQKLYDTEKPYSAEFEIPEEEGRKRTNYVLSAEQVDVETIQSCNDHTLDANGFCILKVERTLVRYDALSDLQDAESEYIDELTAILRQKFPYYVRLEAIECVVSSELLNVRVSIANARLFLGDTGS